jgi:hypothetical protein
MTDGYELPEDNADGTTQKEENDHDEREYALSLLKEDHSRQLQLASDRQNTLLQSIGILVAFASVIFVQKALDTSIPSENGIEVLADPIFLCCIVGIGTIMMSWKFGFHMGMNVRRSAERYNEGLYGSLTFDIVLSLYHANLRANGRNRWLNIILILAALLFLIGIIKIIAG